VKRVAAQNPTLSESDSWVDVEQAVLGACLTNPTLLDVAGETLRPDQFNDPLHERIFSAMLSAKARGEIASPLTIAVAMKSDPANAELEVGAYLKSIALSAPNSAGVIGRLIEIVADLDQRRALARYGAEIEAAARRGSEEAPTTEIIETAQKNLTGILEGTPRDDDPQPITVSASETVNRLNRSDRSKAMVPFGVAGLDDLYGGMGAGDLIVLAGRTGMGKTAVAIAMADRAADQGFGVYFDSLEMTRDQVSERWLSARMFATGLELPYSALRHGQVADNWADKLANEAVEAARMPLYIDDRRGQTLTQLSSRARRLQAKLARGGVRLGLIIVDHLQRVRADQNYRGNLHAEATDTARGMKDLAGQLGLPIVCLCQLNRKSEDRADNRPYLSDLRNSGSIEEEADTAILLNRPEYYLSRQEHEAKAKGDEEYVKWETDMLRAQNKIFLDVAKARHGKPQEVTARCNIACNWISAEKVTGN